MKRILWITAQILLLVTVLGAGTGDELLKKVDALASFLDTDFSAEYTITQSVPGQGVTQQTVALFRRDRENKYTMIILKPEADKGKGYLKIDNNLWFYDPKSRKFQVTSAKDRFQNSNARNSDFTRSTLAADYEVLAVTKEKLGTFDCSVLELSSDKDGVSFPKMKIWISEDGLLRKSEDYSLSGQLLRTTAIPAYQKFGNRSVPVNIIMVDSLRGKKVDGKFVNERTSISIAKPSLDAVPDLVFTQAYLEKVSR